MSTRASRIALVTTALMAAACSQPATTTDAGADSVVGPDSTGTDGASDTTPGEDVVSDASSGGDGGLVAERPYTSRAPRTIDPSRPLPLVILLHGYGASGSGQELYFRLGALVESRQFLYAYPDGTLDSGGRRFWNASDACCDFERRGIDDVAYVNAIIDDMSARYPVDTRRIYLVGHSNGGFMSHRFACEMSSRVAAIVSLAGVPWSDMSRCAADHPVSVLQVHGDADTTIQYGGGSLGIAAYPSARASVEGWAMRNGCTGAIAATGTTLDLDTGLPGAETRVEAASACPTDGAVEFWTILGGAHIPSFGAAWAPGVIDWLMAHPKR